MCQIWCDISYKIRYLFIWNCEICFRLFSLNYSFGRILSSSFGICRFKANHLQRIRIYKTIRTWPMRDNSKNAFQISGSGFWADFIPFQNFQTLCTPRCYSTKRIYFYFKVQGWHCGTPVTAWQHFVPIYSSGILSSVCKNNSFWSYQSTYVIQCLNHELWSLLWVR